MKTIFNDRDDAARALYGTTTRERVHETYKMYTEIISKLGDGVAVMGGIPWDDPRFQEMLLTAIGVWRQYKRDAEKLAVIREVFGGKS